MMGAPFSMAEHFSTGIPEVISSEKKHVELTVFGPKIVEAGPDSLVF